MGSMDVNFGQEAFINQEFVSSLTKESLLMTALTDLNYSLVQSAKVS